MQVGIVGLGLMGGSLGLAIRRTGLFKEIVGMVRNELHAQQALTLGLVDEIVSFEEIAQCDVIFLCTPVEGIIDALKRLTDVPETTTIIDMGSTKGKIVESVPPTIRKNFVAAHPMCGTEKFGPTAAIPDLYEEKIVVLCNTQDSGEAQARMAKELFLSIGMRVTKMDAHEHDRHAAFISHLPHAISFSLAGSVLAQENPESILVLAAGGFRDMSRIAKSSPRMWTEIFKQNKQYLLESLDSFEHELAQCRKMIEEEEWDGLESRLESSGKLHDFL